MHSCQDLTKPRCVQRAVKHEKRRRSCSRYMPVRSNCQSAFSLWVLKRIRNFYIAGKETTTIEKKFDFVAFFVCFPVVTYLAPQISSYQIDGVTSGCFGIQLVWCLKLLYIQFHDPEGNTPE